MTYSDSELPHVLTQIARLSDAVKAEFDLIGTRMTWLVVSQSFMFATFTAAASNGGHGNFATVLKYFVCMIPILGATVACLVGSSIVTAHSVAISMKEQRDKFICNLPAYLEIKLVSSRDKAHKYGNLPAKFVPWLFSVAWVGAIVFLPMPPW